MILELQDYRWVKGITHMTERVCLEASLKGAWNEELDSDWLYTCRVDGQTDGVLTIK